MLGKSVCYVDRFPNLQSSFTWLTRTGSLIQHYDFGGIMKSTVQIVLRPTIAVLALLASPIPVGAQTATYNEKYTIQGFSQPARISAVAASIPGILQSRQVCEGDRVRAGVCLVQLDRSIHNAKLEFARVAKEATGELEIARAELAAKRSRLERLTGLAERKHATTVELLQATEDVAVARASVRRAQDRLAQQRADYERLVAESEQYCVKAPFDGVVVEFVKQAGEYVGPGESHICTIADLDELSVEFLVPRPYRGNLAVGASVDIVFTVANRTVTGMVSYISPFPNGETSTYKVKARVDNTKGTLSAGERCVLKNVGSSPAQQNASPENSVTVRGQ